MNEFAKRKHHLISNRTHQSLSIVNPWDLILDNYEPINFVISGGVNIVDRLSLLHSYLKRFIGQNPIVVMHGEDTLLEQVLFDLSQKYNCKYDIVNIHNKIYEPFLGMEETQIIKVLKNIASQLQYTMTPHFENVVRTYMKILSKLNIPICLSGFYYLCTFDDIQEFHQNIIELFGEEQGYRVWSAFEIDNPYCNTQYELFHIIILRLADSFKKNGWSDDFQYGNINLLQETKNSNIISISINNLFNDITQIYFAEELKGLNKNTVFLIDDVKLNDASFYNLLEEARFHCGIISRDLMNMVGNNEQFLVRFIEKSRLLIILKHGTSINAEFFSKIIGNYEHIKTDYTEGVNHDYFKLFPKGKQKSIHRSIENKYRVMPEQIMSLDKNQAVILDILNNKILFLN